MYLEGLCGLLAAVRRGLVRVNLDGHLAVAAAELRGGNVQGERKMQRDNKVTPGD